MSASRKCLLAAALCGAMTPTATTWAQGGAYGAKSIVEHNDLRWFEPVELDIDGQMPHRDAGWFASFDKLYWATVHPRVEIGDEGRTVDSEQLFRAPTPEAALLFVGQVELIDFISAIPDPQDRVQAALTYSGVIIEDANGNDVTSTITSLDQLADRLRLAPNDPNFVIPGGAPDLYQVRNGIRDALSDANFAWGERYEFGYSDGEHGWMIGVLDGPEANAGGTWGAPNAPYDSQSGTAIPGTDPNYAGDLEDDDGDGQLDGDGEQGSPDLFALGFGSVAVNFELPNDDFLKGFRDYNNGLTPWTTSGPLLYVGNAGTVFTEVEVIDFPEIGGNGNATIGVSLNAINSIQAELATQPPTNIDTPGINLDYTTIAGQMTALILSDDPVVAALAQQILNLSTANPPPYVNPIDTPAEVTAAQIQAAQIRGLILQLNQQIAADGDGVADADIDAVNLQRQADDLNGNAAPGFVRVFAEVDGVQQLVGIIMDFGDLHTFNVFFDQVTVRNRTEIDGVELMRMHEISTRHKLEQGRFDDLRFTYGVRFLSVKDDFYAQGLGSILGRTTIDTDVENQIVGPQIGLRWSRNDGPWNFVVEGRGMVGYNIVDVDQYGIFGEELIPGALNRPANARTTTSVDGERFDEFSPIGELRAQLKYRLSDSISLQAGYTAKFVGNIHRGSTATRWAAPDWGIYDRKGDFFTNGLNFGVEFRH